MAPKPHPKSTGRTADHPATIAFAPFLLDLRSGQLLRHDMAIALRPKTWAVLVYLAERPGMLVAKDALLDAVWPETAVTPDTLNKSIGELRAALDDNSQAPRFIETVHRRGFRFIAKISGASATGSALLGQGSGARVQGSAARDLLTPDIRHLTPDVFVGRAPELRQLEELFAKAQLGQRQIAFITGAAGIGKTALVDAFLHSPAVREAVAPVWIGRAGCIEHHGPREAYLPVLEALEQLARRQDAERLRQLLRRSAPTWLVQIPWLVGAADMEGFQQSLQAVRAKRMLREFAALVEALTTDLTAVLVLEDLHWSDPSTVDLITELGQRGDPARVLLIASYRPAELAVREHVLATTVRSLQIRRQCVEVQLADLTEDAVHSYLAARFPGSDFPRSLAHRIHAHTGGAPLFMVAIVDHMRTRGWILDTAPGWAITAPPETIDLGVPDDVRRMIESQLHHLSPTERDLLEAASVAGQEVVVPLVAAALGCEVGDAELRCETLARTRRFLDVAGTTEWPDGGVTRRYAFTHELHRRVAYEGIPEGRRARLHRRVGEALEAAHGAQAVDIAAQLALHFERGRDRERALRYLTAAGARARRRFANREAIAYFEPALALLALLPDAEERCRRELEIRLGLGPAVSDVHGFTAEQVRVNYERAAELCVTVGTAAQHFEVLYALWYWHALRADRNQALAMAADLDDLARQLGTAEHGVVADSVLLRTALYDGRFADTRASMESLLARQGQPTLASTPVAYGVDPVIAATMHYAIALWFLGEPEPAEATARAGIARARQTGNPFFRCAALVQGAILDLLCRNSAAGLALAEQAGSLAAEQGFAYWGALASGLRGWASVQQGLATEGVHEIESALIRTRAMGARFFTTFLLAALAEGRLRAGAVADGLAAAEEGLGLTQTTLDRSFEPEIWRLKGELLLEQSKTERSKSKARGTKRRGTAEQAETCFQRALAVARATLAKSLELRAATSLARAWRVGGRAADAHALLDDVCARFGARTDSIDLVEARALLKDLRPNRPARSKSAAD